MSVTSLTKVGNSMAIVLPKALREEAGIEPDTPLRLSSPRKGVVVVTMLEEDAETRLGKFREAEKKIEAASNHFKAWPKGKNAADLMRGDKDAN